MRKVLAFELHLSRQQVIGSVDSLPRLLLPVPSGVQHGVVDLRGNGRQNRMRGLEREARCIGGSALFTRGERTLGEGRIEHAAIDLAQGGAVFRSEVIHVILPGQVWLGQPQRITGCAQTVVPVLPELLFNDRQDLPSGQTRIRRPYAPGKHGLDASRQYAACRRTFCAKDKPKVRAKASISSG